MDIRRDADLLRAMDAVAQLRLGLHRDKITQASVLLLLPPDAERGFFGAPKVKIQVD